jgi:hypothetical protein
MRDRGGVAVDPRRQSIAGGEVPVQLYGETNFAASPHLARIFASLNANDPPPSGEDEEGRPTESSLIMLMV